jgi:hypothetical protein
MDKPKKTKPDYNSWKSVEKMTKKELQSEVARLTEILEITARRLDLFKVIPPKNYGKEF